MRFEISTTKLNQHALDVLSQHGIVLSNQELAELAHRKNDILDELDRIEVGRSALETIIEAFAPSPCISGNDAFGTFMALTDAFYSVRDELPVFVPDDDIIEQLQRCFEDNGGHADMLDLVSIVRELNPASQSSEYSITDDEGRVYRWNPADWEDDEFCNGWDGESWSGVLDD